MATPTANFVPTQTYALSGLVRIDGLLDGVRWGNGGIGTAVALTYSFPGDIGYWLAVYGVGEPDSYGALNATEQSAARSALQAWANVANVTFTEVTDTDTEVGEIRFAYSTAVSPDAQAHAYPLFDGPEAGDVWLNSNADWDGFSKGSYDYFTLVHEIGHALGLKHPFETSAFNATLLPVADDATFLTVMSYSAWPGDQLSGVNYNPTTPMWYDIASAQYLYGANNTYHAGNDVYTFVQGRFYNQTIWDAGGVDKIVWSATTQGATIDLRSGQWNDLGNSLTYTLADGSRFTDKDTVIIYEGVVIENAQGGAAADIIRGNAIANKLIGGGGADRLIGGGGADVLTGGVGADKSFGGAGADRFKFNKFGEVSKLSARDLIGDFDAADIVDLSGIDANSRAGGNQAFRFIGGHAFGGHAGELRFGGGTLSGDINGDGAADFRIEVDFKGISRLSALDIIE